MVNPASRWCWIPGGGEEGTQEPSGGEFLLSFGAHRPSCAVGGLVTPNPTTLQTPLLRRWSIQALPFRPSRGAREAGVRLIQRRTCDSVLSLFLNLFQET